MKRRIRRILLAQSKSGFARIKDGDSSTFVAVRAEEPDDPIPPPPSYRDKWRRHRRAERV